MKSKAFIVFLFLIIFSLSGCKSDAAEIIEVQPNVSFQENIPSYAIKKPILVKSTQEVCGKFNPDYYLKTYAEGRSSIYVECIITNVENVTISGFYEIYDDDEIHAPTNITIKPNETIKVWSNLIRWPGQGFIEKYGCNLYFEPIEKCENITNYHLDYELRGVKVGNETHATFNNELNQIDLEILAIEMWYNPGSYRHYNRTEISQHTAIPYFAYEYTEDYGIESLKLLYGFPAINVSGFEIRNHTSSSVLIENNEQKLIDLLNKIEDVEPMESELQNFQRINEKALILQEKVAIFKVYNEKMLQNSTLNVEEYEALRHFMNLQIDRYNELNKLYYNNSDITPLRLSHWHYNYGK